MNTTLFYWRSLKRTLRRGHSYAWNWLSQRWSDRRSLGARGERLAERYLRRQGMRILHRGYRIMGGEVDLVAVDGRTVVFVEVKTRQSHDAGHPADAVD